jgi:glucosamine kinase
MRHVLGIDAGGTKTRALLADETGHVVGRGLGGGANLKTHGELEVEKVLHCVIEEAEAEAGTKPDSVALGIAGADRPEDHMVLRSILRRMGFRQRVLVTNDARIALVAGSPSRVGLALICGTGSIAWGQNASGEIARAGGWGWHVGDEGSGFWIGVRAVRAALKASDGRGPSTALIRLLLDHFEITGVEDIVRVVYGGGFPRHRIALFAPRVAEAAAKGDAAAREILEAAAAELAEAAQSVIRRLSLPGRPYDIVLSGGTFAAVPWLVEAVTSLLRAPAASVRLLTDEPAAGAVRLALEQLA